MTSSGRPPGEEEDPHHAGEGDYERSGATLHSAPPLLGVLASPLRVEARLIELTPFGRFRAAGRRVVEDVDGPTEFLPLSLERQLAGGPPVPDEARAGQAWVETVANAIAKLTFGLRGGKPRVGLCLDAKLDAGGRRVDAVEGGARVQDFVDQLETALRGRNIDLATPIGRAYTLGEAWTLGEQRSALGGLAGVPEALVLVWDRSVSWTRVARGRVIQSAAEPRGGSHDFGLLFLDDAQSLRTARARRVFVAARSGDKDASELLTAAALALGREAARRLFEWPVADHRLHPDPPPDADRILLAGLVGRQASDERLRSVLLDPFTEGLARGLAEREDAARERGLLVPLDGLDPAPDFVLEVGSLRLALAPGLLQISQEDAAATIGAATTVASATSISP
ncbi:MAG: hypothetical protein ACJAZN_000375 [Planctomycetota bacterium]